MPLTEDGYGQPVLACSLPDPEPSVNSQQHNFQGVAPSAAADPMVPIQQQARYLRQAAAAGYLNASNGALFKGQLEPLAYNQYVADLLQDTGNPSDPVERMLVEQLVLAHHNIGRLHVEAAAAKGTAETALLNAAVARLLSEFRKTALALKTYRLPSATPQTTPAKSATATVNQPPASHPSKADPGTAESRASLYSQLRNGNGNGHHDTTPRFSQSQARCRREEELVETAGAHG